MFFLQQADSAFAKGDLQKAGESLNKHLTQFPKDARIWHRLALLEEQIGNVEKAGIAHRKCIELVPGASMAYFYAGLWFAKFDKSTAAAAFSLAYDIDPTNFIALKNDQNDDLNLRDKSAEAFDLMTKLLENQHKAVTTISKKISNATWVRYNKGLINSPSESNNSELKEFKPELFKIDGVRKQPFYDFVDFPWSENMLLAGEAIKQELTHFLSTKNSKESFRPYLERGSMTTKNLNDLAGSPNWAALDLFKNGQPNPAIHPHFSTTLQALKGVPTYGLGEHPFEVFFSVLKPGQSIAPHYGQSNHSLTVHLPIVVPNDAYLLVDNVRKDWNNEPLIIFDDSFLHSAHNHSAETRIILLFSIWHPDLSSNDKLAVQTAFSERGNWFDNRYHLVMSGLPSSQNGIS